MNFETFRIELKNSKTRKMFVYNVKFQVNTY